MMKRLLIVMGLVVGLGVGLTGYATGQTASVGATVTPKNISVSIDVTSIEYGVVDLSSTDNIPTDPVGPTADPVITATNTSNVAADFAIRGANATGTGGDTTWNLVDGTPNSIGTDAYQHKFAKDTTGLTDLAPLEEDGGGDPVATSLATGVTALTGTQSFKLRLDAPTGSTGVGERTTSVTVIATG